MTKSNEGNETREQQQQKLGELRAQKYDTTRAIERDARNARGELDAALKELSARGMSDDVLNLLLDAQDALKRAITTIEKELA